VDFAGGKSASPMGAVRPLTSIWKATPWKFRYLNGGKDATTSTQKPIIPFLTVFQDELAKSQPDG
jgi:hypothetical protein